MPESARPSKCPKCGSGRVAEIVYGMPASDPELGKEVETGRIVLGGCVVPREPPQWQCLACRHKWGEARLEDAVREASTKKDKISLAFIT